LDVCNQENESRWNRDGQFQKGNTTLVLYCELFKWKAWECSSERDGDPCLEG